MSITRVWTASIEKLEDEGSCRVCGAPNNLEQAHVLGREYDKFTLDGEPQTSKTWRVEPDRIVPLCKPHHEEYDRHELDLLEHLTGLEQVQAVKDAGRIETARRRLAPSEYRD